MYAEQNSGDWLDLFSGGVPTAPFFFDYTLNGLEKVYLNQSENTSSHINELCVIGLVSYFEAFCKDHFASIINIEPSLLNNLSKNGQDISIEPTKALELGTALFYNIGFLVAEKYDFGTAQKINALYRALIMISPFSKDEIKIYDNLLRDRNLLVHHGGIYTSSYIAQNRNTLAPGLTRPFFNSLVVSKSYVEEKFNFIKEMARKILTASHTSLNQYLAENAIQISEWKQKAVNSFLEEL
ncbi:hypothetical protein [Anabaena azotica]|uniref:Apea-like HEPN domain-containing protein n=1 Tax=Anabaena azotica FACHB-119 TaxID=947527 RepID=A0ABR8DA80_9NOST|nr:hypothetical protein [Anabaena azotica]MBD2503046.1 hypothetical protein [Anabaena azotica FACHB-119]